jgi:D-tyrosyl-tRNA(Tyr) deacylase
LLIAGAGFKPEPTMLEAIVAPNMEKDLSSGKAHDLHNAMRAVVQRVSEAEVRVSGESVGKTGRGLLVLLGVEKGDSEADAEYLAEKIAGLRIFEDENGKMNLGIQDVSGEMLVVSQFTLAGDCRKGRRPSLDNAAEPEKAESLYEVFVGRTRETGIKVETGRFRAVMDVHLVNHGPVTFILDSGKRF